MFDPLFYSYSYSYSCIFLHAEDAEAIALSQFILPINPKLYQGLCCYNKLKCCPEKQSSNEVAIQQEGI